MKDYLFTAVCLLASIALIIFRGVPSFAILFVSGVILATSISLTAIGRKGGVDDMWWRMAIAILAPLIIGISQAQ